MSDWNQIVTGQPDPSLSSEEVERIIADAKAHGQNVYFGEGWKHPKQEARLLYMSQAPVETGIMAGIAGFVASLF